MLSRLFLLTLSVLLINLPSWAWGQTTEWDSNSILGAPILVPGSTLTTAALATAYPDPSLCQSSGCPSGPCGLLDQDCGCACGEDGDEGGGFFWEVFDPQKWVQPWVMRTSLRQPQERPRWAVDPLPPDNGTDGAIHEVCHWLDHVRYGLVDDGCGVLYRVCGDVDNFYLGDGLRGMALAVAVAAPIANTHADQGIRDWYQTRLRTRTTDEWAKVGKSFGEYKLAIPVYAAVAVGGLCFDHTWAGSLTEEWGERSLRALLVGSPAVGVLQLGLGSSRPGEGPSHWHPFNDNNGVSGHAFVGAVPFLTAAAMTDNKLLKIPLVLGSFWTAWSRINDDAHYFSQTLLGWSFAFLAVQSVTQTELDAPGFSLVPLELPGTSGIGVMYRY